MMMVTAGRDLSSDDAERFRSFEREQHDNLAAAYHEFFTPVTALAIKPVLEAVRLRAGTYLLDVATGPGCLLLKHSSQVRDRSVSIFRPA
jgi:hypothetical protein